jgi:hypothetical protein
MAKTISTDKLIEIVLSIPFDEKVQVFDALKAQIAIEATTRKTEGEKADQVLKSLNGKQ